MCIGTIYRQWKINENPPWCRKSFWIVEKKVIMCVHHASYKLFFHLNQPMLLHYFFWQYLHKNNQRSETTERHWVLYEHCLTNLLIQSHAVVTLFLKGKTLENTHQIIPDILVCLWKQTHNIYPLFKYVAFKAKNPKVSRKPQNDKYGFIYWLNNLHDQFIVTHTDGGILKDV